MTFRDDVDPEFASMWFYGAIEQLLSGWVFEIIPDGEADFERARRWSWRRSAAGSRRRRRSRTAARGDGLLPAAAGSPPRG